MKSLWQDLRYGLRTLSRKKGLTLAAVLTLALAIGANTAIFSVVNAVLLRPLPYPEAERLVRLGSSNPKTGVEIGTLSPPDFYDLRAGGRVFEGASAVDGWSPSLTGGGEPERVSAARVSANFFEVLGVRPALGRGFVPQEEVRGNHLVAVLGEGLWRRRFNSDPSVVGRGVTLNGVSYTVVGVMPRGFEPPRFAGGDSERPELWAPFAPDLKQWGRSGRSVDAAVARLKEGVSLDEARAEVSALAARLREQYPETNANTGAAVESLHEHLVGGVRKPLLLLLGAVGFVLLIACANVANLLMARAAGRRREFAIRAALGAGGRRILRQLLTESLLLSVLGGAAGLLLAMWASDLLVRLGPQPVQQLGAVGADARVAAFTLAVTVLTGVVFGLAPALQAARADLSEVLNEGGAKGAGSGAARSPLRNALIVSEVALSLVLLVGAGLLVRSFLSLQTVSPGFDARGVLTMYVFLPGAKYPEEAQHADFFERAAERLRSLPGVEAVGLTSNLPVSGNYDRLSLYVEEHPPASR
ncbi:MAG TPA: ADOP family duplicated permease, partial [Pyrinomonadaceae bacterium]|nr:ADOP family duplicated permease [Pyrinomonadaceae bacterium]